MANLETERALLEAAYAKASLPPWRLIYRILICGSIGTFFAVMSARTLMPNKIPTIQIVYPTSERIHE